jgi:hypothetical protein
MERPTSRPGLAPYLLAGSLAGGILCDAQARAQGPDKDKGGSPPGGDAAAKRDRQGAKGERQGAKGAAGGDQKQAKAQMGPSEEYQESIRRTVERRRERRARRGQGTGGSVPAGAIVPWPMPPVLIIRQTRETHDEIDSFLRTLR